MYNDVLGQKLSTVISWGWVRWVCLKLIHIEIVFQILLLKFGYLVFLNAFLSFLVFAFTHFFFSFSPVLCHKPHKIRLQYTLYLQYITSNWWYTLFWFYWSYMFKMLMQRNPYASRGLENQRLPKATLSEQWAMMGSSTSLVEIFKIDWNFLYYGYVPGLQE